MFEYDLDLSENSYMRDYTVDGARSSFSPRMLECGYFEAGSNYYTQRDGKNAALIIYTVSGSGTLEMNRQKLSLTPGTAIIFGCREEHCYKTATAPWCFYWAHCDLESLSGYDEILSGKLFSLKNDEQIRLNEVFFRIREIFGRDDIFSYGYRSGSVSEMLGVLLRAAEYSSGKNIPKSEEIERTLIYINENLSRQIGLDELCETAHMSKYHFIRVFRKYTGYPPYKYLMTARINRAKQLLTTTDLPVGSISEEVGFSESANFSKVFHSLTGETPSAYRSGHFHR